MKLLSIAAKDLPIRTSTKEEEKPDQQEKPPCIDNPATI